MSILVTGAAGLIGARIVHILVEQGETVIALDRTLQTGRLDTLRAVDAITAVECNVTNLSAVDALIAEHDVERIIHTAAILPPTSEENPRLCYDVNIGGTNNIFEAAHKNHVKRVVYPSSISTYNDQSDYGDAVLDEDSAQRPFSLYGVTKLANEFAARAYTKNTGLDCRGLRIGSVFGHGRQTGRSAAASVMISKAAVGEPYTCPVAASQTSPYVYADDVAAFMIRTALSENLQYDVYCVSAHTASLQNIADITSAFMPGADISFAPDAAGFVQISQLSGARLTHDLGYEMPSLKDRIRHQIDTARRERQLPPRDIC